MLRRAGGRIRFLPTDLVAAPLLAAGVWLLLGLDLVTNRVADGGRTVRLLIAAPGGWLDAPAGWVGLLLLAGGAAAATLAKRRVDPHRWGTAVRYPPFAAAGALLAIGAFLSMWQTSAHLTDVAAGGAEWRFQAAHRTHWANDLTTVLLAVAAAACYALSFGRRRLEDFEAWEARQATRERVPATTRASASTSSTMATGEAIHSRSSRGSRPPEGS